MIAPRLSAATVRARSKPLSSKAVIPRASAAGACGADDVRTVVCGRSVGAIRRADQDRLWHISNRRACSQRQVGAARAEDLGGGYQRQGRTARTSGQAHLLRRPDQPGHGARHLHQAARRRQGRSDHRRLRHQHAGAGDAGRRAEEEDVGLFGLAVNSEFHYPNYFAMIPSGPAPKTAFTKGFFDTAMAQNPKPQTVAIVAADAEFSVNASEGARDNAKVAGLKVVYDKRYPPSTTDFAPIVRAIQPTNPDIVMICSYPPDSVGMVKAINEIGFKPKMMGGGLVGLQATAIKTQLGPLLNGLVNYDFWLPVPKMDFPGVADFLKKYQARAGSEGVDPLGYYIGPWGYAQMEVLAQAIVGTKSLNDDKLADYIRANTFKTVVGDVKFGKDGEWAQSRVLQIQFQNVKGNDVTQFKDISTQVVLTPSEYASGNVIYPYEKAK